MTVRAPMPTCPMAETCKGMMEKPFSGIALMIPGIVFLLLGVLIFFEPRIVAWILAIAFVLIGLMLLMMANFLRKMGLKLKNT